QLRAESGADHDDSFAKKQKETKKMRAEVRTANVQLAEAIATEIAELRTDLFGDASVPFKTYDDAVRWIEQAPRPHADAKNCPTRTSAGPLLTQARRQGLKMIRGVERLIVAPRTRWGMPAEITRQMAEACGYGEALLVAHILADVPLILP